MLLSVCMLMFWHYILIYSLPREFSLQVARVPQEAVCIIDSSTKFSITGGVVVVFYVFALSAVVLTVFVIVFT